MAGQIGAIAAMTRDRVIGLNNDIPWRYPEDWKRFKEITLNSTVIMGRKTWESIGSKPLPLRQNIVITRSKLARLEGVAHTSSIEIALDIADKEIIWFIGGGNIYAQALQYCDHLDITWVPDIISDPNTIRFPEISPEAWQAETEQPLASDPRLVTQQFHRR